MKINKNWYSVVFILLIIWFIFLLTVWVFSLIFNENKNVKMMWNYIKAYAWAESSQELAILSIKENGYEFNESISPDINEKSVMLSEDFDLDTFNTNKYPKIWYDNDWKTNIYSWTIDPLSYHIIPLLYLDESLSEKKVTSIDFSINSWNSSDLSWNILSQTSWLTWTWEVDSWIYRDLDLNGLWWWENSNVDNFLNDNNTNYLVLFNTSDSDNVSYEISAINPDEYFTKPEITIVSSAQIGDYKQNIETKISNADILNFLKYSIYTF